MVPPSYQIPRESDRLHGNISNGGFSRCAWNIALNVNDKKLCNFTGIPLCKIAGTRYQQSDQHLRS